jgi:hypothetical protein
VYWKPDLYIENALGNLSQEVRYRVEKQGQKTIIVEMRNIKGFFWERLELWDFPLGILFVFIHLIKLKVLFQFKDYSFRYSKFEYFNNDYA